MDSKRATKETNSRIYCIATAIKPTLMELAGPVSVIPVALASSVIYIVTQSWGFGVARWSCRNLWPRISWQRNCMN
jgi:hypothetical protein